MAVELASAYVSIIPTTKGLQGNLEKELSPLTGVAAKAGDDSGKALGSSFTGASGGLKSSVGEATGHLDKFKAGATSAMDSVGISTGMLATAGGAALVGFAVSAVGAFTDTAKAAVDLGASTGLAVEDASRWIAVGDDFQVGADQLESGIGKIAKSLDAPKWGKYGIATRDAAGQARSANDVFEDSLVKLSSITNETERARVGNELFGKGYSSLAPLIGHTKDEYDKMLGSVEKGQVITDKEAAKAEKFRLAQDQLSDALHEVTLEVGQQVAGLAPLLISLAKLVALLGGGAGDFLNFDSGAGDVINTLYDLRGEADKGGKSWESWRDDVLKGKVTLDEAVTKIHESALAHSGVTLSLKEQAAQVLETDVENRRTIPTWQSVADAEKEVADAAEAARVADVKFKLDAAITARDVKQGIDEMIGKWDELTGDVDADKSWITLQGSFETTKQKFLDANEAIKKGTDDANQKTLDYKGSLDDVILSTIGYGKEVLGLPPEKLVAIKATLESGELQRALDMVAILTRNKNINIAITARGGAGYNDTGGSSFATGGYTPGGTVMVGEQGRELVNLPRGSYVHTASDTRSMMTANTSQTSNAGSTPPITVVNNRRDIGVADLNHVLAMARLAS